MFSTSKISQIRMFGQKILGPFQKTMFLSLFLAFPAASGQAPSGGEVSAEESREADSRPMIILQSPGPAAEAEGGEQLLPPEEEMTEEERQALEKLALDMREGFGSFMASGASAVEQVLQAEGLLSKQAGPSNQFILRLAVTNSLQAFEDMFLFLLGRRDLSIPQKRDMLEALTGAFNDPSKLEEFKSIVKDGEANRESVIQNIFLDSSRTHMAEGAPVRWEANQIYAVQSNGVLVQMAISSPPVSILNGMSHEDRKQFEEVSYQRIIDSLEQLSPQAVGINMDMNYHSLGLMKLGNYIREKGLDLHIFGYCSSPCSRYLLPAARNIHIGPYGVIFYESAAPSLIVRDIGKKIQESQSAALENHIANIESLGGPVHYLYNLGDKRENYLKGFITNIFVNFSQQQFEVSGKLIDKVIAYHKKQSPFDSLSADEVSGLFAGFSPEELRLLDGFLSENAQAGGGFGAKKAAERLHLMPIKEKEERLSAWLKSKSEAAFDKFSSALRKLRESKSPLAGISWKDFQELFAGLSPEELKTLSVFLFSIEYKFSQRDSLFDNIIAPAASEELEFFKNLKNPAYVNFLLFSHSLVKYDPNIERALFEGGEGALQAPYQERAGYYVAPRADLLRKLGLNIVEGENQTENLSSSDPRKGGAITLDAETYENCVRLKDEDGSYGESARACARAN